MKTSLSNPFSGGLAAYNAASRNIQNNTIGDSINNLSQINARRGVQDLIGQGGDMTDPAMQSLAMGMSNPQQQALQQRANAQAKLNQNGIANQLAQDKFGYTQENDKSLAMAKLLEANTGREYKTSERIAKENTDEYVQSVKDMEAEEVATTANERLVTANALDNRNKVKAAGVQDGRNVLAKTTEYGRDKTTAQTLFNNQEKSKDKERLFDADQSKLDRISREGIANTPNYQKGDIVKNEDGTYNRVVYNSKTGKDDVIPSDAMAYLSQEKSKGKAKKTPGKDLLDKNMAENTINLMNMTPEEFKADLEDSKHRDGETATPMGDFNISDEQSTAMRSTFDDVTRNESDAFQISAMSPKRRMNFLLSLKNQKSIPSSGAGKYFGGSDIEIVESDYQPKKDESLATYLARGIKAMPKMGEGVQKSLTSSAGGDGALTVGQTMDDMITRFEIMTGSTSRLSLDERKEILRQNLKQYNSIR